MRAKRLVAGIAYAKSFAARLDGLVPWTDRITFIKGEGHRLTSRPVKDLDKLGVRGIQFQLGLELPRAGLYLAYAGNQLCSG